jgi:DNA repair protein RadC
MSAPKTIGRVSVYELSLRRSGSVVWPLSENVEASVSAAPILRALIGHRDCEHFAILMLGPRLGVLGVHVAAIGGLHGISVSMRDVFKAPLLANASSIILGHNHPSGDPTPSADDRAFTERAVKFGRELGCPVVDHVVVTDAGPCISFHQEGFL